MEPLGTALLTDEIPAHRAITTIVSREEIASALQDPEHSPELYLDVRSGDEQSTVVIGWSHDELEKLLDRAGGDDIVFTFDRDELQSAFGDVEAHGLRERALIFTVAVAGAIGSSAAIANAAPTIEHGTSAATAAQVENMAAQSTGGMVSNVHTPGVQIGDESATAPVSSVKPARVVALDGGLASNVHIPGVQTGDETSAAPTVSVSAVHAAAVDGGLASNVHTPGLQTGDETSAAPTASVKAIHVAATDTGLASNVHTPGLQIGDETSTGSVPAVHVSTSSSDGEFLGIDTRDATEALIAGGLLLAIAGATFAGTRRPGSARPA